MNAEFRLQHIVAKLVGPLASVVPAIFILLALALIWYVASTTGGWPVEPMNGDHPIANSLGEVVMSCNEDSGEWELPYQHAGVDILAPHSGSPDPPYVVNMSEGYLVWLTHDSALGNQHAAHILAKNCKQKYIYTHLDRDTMFTSFTDKLLKPEEYDLESCTFNAPEKLVAVEEAIAMIEDAYVDDTDHLHLQIEATDSNVTEPFINGLKEIWPNPDMNDPDPVEIHLAQHDTDPWDEFLPGSSPGSCTVILGIVDIIVRVGDRDDAGSPAQAASNIFVHNVAWRACPATNPACTANWNASHLYDSMSNDFAAGFELEKRFSMKSRWQTRPEPWVMNTAAEKCASADEPGTYMILGKSGTGSWKTTQKDRFGQAMYPNGDYILSVKARGIGGNPVVATTPVCIRNP